MRRLLANPSFGCYTPVLVFWGCPNKLPPPGWLKTTGIYSLTASKARSLKSRCQRARPPPPPKPSEKSLSLPLITSVSNPQCSSAYRPVTPTSTIIMAAWHSPCGRLSPALLSLRGCLILTNCIVLFPNRERARAPHSSALAWKIPRTGEPGGLQSMGLRRVGHD